VPRHRQHIGLHSAFPRRRAMAQCQTAQPPEWDGHDEKYIACPVLFRGCDGRSHEKFIGRNPRERQARAKVT
jgi:hypothetical protein